MRNRSIVIGGLIAASVFWIGLPSGADEARKPDSAAAELVDAAKNALRVTEVANIAGRAKMEDVYQWSRRLMEAEQAAGNADASTDHLQRMENLYQSADTLYKANAKGSSVNKVAASKFYFLEAQAMNAKK